MTRKHPSLRVKLLRQLRPWHRRIGIFSTLFVIFMAVSGVLINHSNHLSLDTAQVKQSWLLDYYGVKAPKDVNLYQQTPQKLISAGNQVWLDTQLILEANSSVLAVISYDQMIVAVDTNHLYLLSQQGELLETQDSATGLPSHIQALGLQDNLWLKTQSGLFVADSDLIDWSQSQPLAAIPWVKTLNNTDSNEITEQIRASRLHWERVLLDLHSGRFFGALGPWMMDLVALALIIMSLTGCYIWLQQKPVKVKRRKK
ncbi:PepSY domain-containing protein [Shewanella gelidimarina]|uniref:PepSY-associated TM helix domain-containing protein n=1 Tax=Shewanella gelidimarina TaxID=56813 RepID=UPI0020107B5F|nr:PepSY-associated TM helix domain-containing protein [Shewanella gelidimarina]MCL1057509.1 PepSY domain-containing protein [Shewanella gelidimarina]